MSRLEELGLLKMDFLGLSTLTILGKSVELARRKDPSLTLETLPLEDPKAYEMLRAGETVGVFQLEGGMTTRMTVDVAPSCFEDLIALMALIRPGPMEMAPDYISRKHGRTPIEYMHPDLEPILQETYGVALYQEQIIRIANVLAGFSMAEGDGLRKAMGKKLPEEMAKYRGRFIEGCEAHGLKPKLGGEIFDMIERFAGYGFNKAHSAAYAVIAAQTAFMKANYPVEFMAAVLTTETGNTEKVVFNIAECRRVGIEVLPPDVNASDLDFSVEIMEGDKEAVRFGLRAIKNVGEGAARSVIEARQRQQDGRFSDLESFCEEVDWSALNKRAAECFAKCGALDGFGNRSAVIGALDAAVAAGQQRQKAAARGQMGLFDMGATDSVVRSGPLVADTELPRRQILAWEKELLGVFLSDHPLKEIIDGGVSDGFAQIGQLGERPTGTKVRVLGLVNSVRRITTRNDRTMAVIELEDLSGSIELVAFPECYEQLSEYWEADKILEVTAKVDRRGDQLQLICETATDDISLKPKPAGPQRSVHVKLPFSSDVWGDIRIMQQVDEILKRYDGEDAVFFHVPTTERVITLRSRTLKIEWSDALARELSGVVGRDGVRIEGVPLVG
jgi:DNA polymerase-3 subunit alpha